MADGLYCKRSTENPMGVPVEHNTLQLTPIMACFSCILSDLSKE